MKIQKAIENREPAISMDYGRFRLRRFLGSLSALDELDIHPKPVMLSEIGRILDGNPRAVLFEQAGNERTALAGNVLGTRKRVAHAFGVEPRQLLGEVLRRLRNRPEIVEVSRDEAPVQEVVAVGAEADLTKLPIHLQHGRDGGPYISAAMDFAVDPATGWTNVGLRRLMLLGPRETGIDLVAPSDLRTIFLAGVARGEPLPVSVVVGSHPIDYFAATMRMAVDEISLIASLRGAPLAVVKSVTNDIRVPADAEWVIEGYLDAKGYTESEGPFGEFLGYYGGMKTNPVFRVTAVTRRRDAIFQTLTISGRTLSITDTAQLCTLRTEVLIWRALENAVREPVAVYAAPATGGVFNVRIAMRQRSPGESHNAIAAAFASLANVKNVFVVDPDVDVFSDEQMEWALGTRFQPHRDLVVASGFRTLPLDPSLHSPIDTSIDTSIPGARVGSKAGFDLTLPFGASGLEWSVPEPPRLEGRSFPSVRAALQDGPKSFQELMAAIGSDDGREVVLALAELREQGKLGRENKQGRYVLK